MYYFAFILRCVIGLLLPLGCFAQPVRFEFTENKMGSPFRLVFYCEDSLKARTLASECFFIADSLNAIFSDYSSRSEAALLAERPQVWQHVSGEMFKMILMSKSAWKTSRRSFDITIGALTQLWRRARQENRFPLRSEIQKAKALTGFWNLSIDTAKKTVLFSKPGMRLDFGGIVKGYAAQKMVDHLAGAGVSSSLADAGGDIALGDSPPGRSGWHIAINVPEQAGELWSRRLDLKNCAVATSGDVYQFMVHAGKKYSHIIDPATGYGITSQRNVTVVAADGETADWLATACSILPVDQAMLLAKRQHAGLLIAAIVHGRIVYFKTDGFDQYFQKSQP